MTGPPFDDDPPLLAELDWSDPTRFPKYTKVAIMKRIKMIQQMVYPPVVTVSDSKFRMVMVSTMTAIIDNMMNSYMYDRRT